MLIPQTNTWEPGYRKRTIKKEFKVGPVSLKFVTIALIAVGMLFYLANKSEGSSQNYQNMQLQSQDQELQAQGNDLAVQAARLRSLNTISSSSQNLGLVPDQGN